MRPHLRACMPGNTSLHIPITDNMFCSSAAGYASNSVDAKFPAGGPPPFAIKMSMCPRIAVASRTNFAPPSPVETSTTMPTHPLPIAFAALATRSASRLQITTRTPSLASACAVAKPKPAEPAATAAVRALIPSSIARNATAISANLVPLGGEKTHGWVSRRRTLSGCDR